MCVPGPSRGDIYRLIVDECSDAISVHDAAGDYTFASPAFTALTGWRPDELVGTSSYAYFHPDDASEVKASHGELMQSPRVTRVQYRFRRSDGTYLWVESTGKLVEVGPAEALIVAVTRDVSTKRTVLAIVEHERALAEEMAQLDQERSTFLRAIAHEARTPLTAVIGFAEILQRKAELTNAQHQIIADRLVASAARLRSLVEEVTEADSLGRRADAFAHDPVDLRELAREAVGALSAPEGVLSILIDRPMVVFGDRVRLEMVVRALVRNAIVHTPVGTEVWVRAEHHPEGIELIVEDSGPGVPDDIKLGIFEAYGQGEVRTDQPGLGLGLYLVSGIVSGHGGRTWVEDRPGGGARFVVLLPRARDSLLPAEVRPRRMEDVSVGSSISSTPGSREA